MASNSIPLQDLQSLQVMEAGPSNPFNDNHQPDPFVVGDSSDADSEPNGSIYDDASSTISRTSTAEYDQECFTTFQHKATQLILEILPGHSSSDVHIERMKGGAFNRIIGITLSSPKPTRSVIGKLRSMLCGPPRGKPKAGKLKHYILRIPRDPTHDVLHQVTTLLYLQKKLAYPTPKVIQCDSTTNNALGRPYMLQERLPGQSLTYLWPSLNQDQRKSAARCIAEVVKDLHKLTSKTPGILSARNTSYDLKQNLLRVVPHPIPSTATDLNAKLAHPQTTRQLLHELCQRQRVATQASGLAGQDHIWDGFARIVDDMHSVGLIPDKDVFHFYHADLYSRNLLFAIQSPTTVRLTGIVDWDSASFAPRFMSTRAPFFLWSEDDADENEEGDAVVEPEDTGKAELKRVFEDVVGKSFCQESYRQEFVLARRMWYFLVNGLRSGGDMFLAEEVREGWVDMYP